MAYILSATNIRRPTELEEENSTQVAQHRTLDGSYRRDYFGSKKRIWMLSYQNTNKTDYDTINTIYNTYITTGTAVSWQVTETNYTVSATTVHVDLRVRNFSIKGTDYISDFDLILTEV